ALDGDQLLAIVYDQTVYGAEGLQLEKTEQTQQEAASPDAPTPEFVGTYQTMLPAADSPGRQITLVLADDNSAQMTTDYMNGEAPIVQTGTWEANDDGTATMTLTAQDGNPYDEPQVITFSMDGDQLDAIVYDRSAYGEEGLHLAKTEQSEQEAATPDFVAVYEAMLPAADSPGRHITLVVGADNTVQMTTDYMNGEDPIVQEGTWQLNDDRTVTVTITGQDGQLYIEPKTITFSLDDDRLAAIDYDLTIYGKNGLKLERQGKPGEMRPAPKRAFLTIDLEAGFALDPFLVSVNAGGTIDASGLSPDCTGYISANPVVSVNWTGEADSVKAFFYSDHDPTLVIQAPDGQYYCNDDANALLLDPMIELDSPPQGEYNIWLGSYSDNQLLPGVLVLTTRPDVSVGTFSLEGLVKRPALPDVLAAPEPRLAATLLTDALANYKGSTVDLAAGGDETSMSVTAEGDIAAFDVPLEGVTCTGYIPAKPDLVFDWSGQADSLQFFFEGDADTTLVVIAPGGKVFCTDDAEPGSNVNPLLVVHDPLEGRYAVFVGRVHPENPVQGTLTVGDDLSSAPRILAPGDQ
ncbi:MAG: copper resistance protein NlpE N-terminal domain-containing protein, partial [Anaerolineae bacterium]